jgi:hypothetical protein
VIFSEEIANYAMQWILYLPKKSCLSLMAMLHKEKTKKKK